LEKHGENPSTVVTAVDEVAQASDDHQGQSSKGENEAEQGKASDARTTGGFEGKADGGRGE
jgi:hypothetical protein